MAEIRSHLKRANIDQPILDIETLAKTIPSKTKAGIGDAKREEVRISDSLGPPAQGNHETQRRVRQEQ